MITYVDESGSAYYESRTFTQWGGLGPLPDRTHKQKFPWTSASDFHASLLGVKGQLSTYTRDESTPGANPQRSVDTDPFADFAPLEWTKGRRSFQVFRRWDQSMPRGIGPALKVVREYADGSRTVLKRVLKYDYALQNRRRGTDRKVARLRSVGEYGPDGVLVRGRTWFYADSRDWHRWTHSESLVRCSVVDGDWRLDGSGLRWACVHHSRYREDEIVPLKDGGSKATLLAGFDCVYFVAAEDMTEGPFTICPDACQESFFGMDGGSYTQGGRTWRTAKAGSVSEMLTKTETESWQGGWTANDTPLEAEYDVFPVWSDSAEGAHVRRRTLNSGQDTKTVLGALTSVSMPPSAPGVDISMRYVSTLSRSGAIASARAVSVGGDYHEEKGWTEATEVSVRSRTYTADGRLAAISCEDTAGDAGPVVTSRREYVYNGPRPVGQTVTFPHLQPDGETTTEILHQYNADGSAGAVVYVRPDAETLTPGEATPPRTDGDRYLDFISSSVMALASRTGLLNARLAASRLAATIDGIEADADSLKSEEVGALVESVRPYAARLSGYVGASHSAWLNFALTAIQCRWGCLTTAEGQLDFMARGVDVMADGSLRSSLVENCDILRWALGRVPTAVSCADGYTYSADLVRSAAGVVSSGAVDVMDSDDVLEESVDMMRLSISRARPQAITDEGRIAVKVVNLALGRMGSSRRILSMDDDSAEAMAARGVFESCRRKVVSAQEWSWAATDARLKSVRNTGLNPERWAYSCRLPSDCVGCVSLWSGRRVDTWEGMVRFEVNGRRLYTDQPDPWLRYVRDASLVDWPELALDALAWEVAADLTMPLTVKPDLATRLFQMAQLSLERAYAHDRNQWVSDVDPDGKLITCRA